MNIYIHTSELTVRSIVLNGYQPGGGNRSQAATTREGWERTNCPSNWVKPSYGAVATCPRTTNASHYGKVVLQLKSEMALASTWTQGDSQLQDNHPKGWSSINKDAMKQRGDSFIEAQVWAEVDRSNIAGIHFIEGKPSEGIKQLCELLEIPLHWMERDYDTWEWVAHQI